MKCNTCRELPKVIKSKVNELPTVAKIGIVMVAVPVGVVVAMEAISSYKYRKSINRLRNVVDSLTYEMQELRTENARLRGDSTFVCEATDEQESENAEPNYIPCANISRNQ